MTNKRPLNHSSMRNRLTRRQFAAGTTASLAAVGLAGCLGDDDDVPDVSFSFDVTDNTVTITHDGGDSLDDSNTGAVQVLRTDGDDELFLEGWELPIEEGGSLTVDGRFESGQTITVRWLTPDEEEFADLESYDI